ncbi:MAG: acyltransferase [Chitinophagaceae bacterium]
MTTRVRNRLLAAIGRLLFKVNMKTANQSVIGGNFTCNGICMLRLKRSSKVTIGNSFKMNNSELFNSIGRQYKCVITVRDNAELTIGDHVGMSSTAIFCNKRIVIGNHVKIGGNVCIYDTDFHSLDWFSRRSKPQDIKEAISMEVLIGNDVFIGAHSTIFKGVKIGDRAVVGSCSVVTKDIPPDEVWAGNPARFIRRNLTESISLPILES